MVYQRRAGAGDRRQCATAPQDQHDLDHGDFSTVKKVSRPRRNRQATHSNFAASAGDRLRHPIRGRFYWAPPVRLLHAGRLPASFPSYPDEDPRKSLPISVRLSPIKFTQTQINEIGPRSRSATDPLQAFRACRRCAYHDRQPWHVSDSICAMTDFIRPAKRQTASRCSPVSGDPRFTAPRTPPGPMTAITPGRPRDEGCSKPADRGAPPIWLHRINTHFCWP